MESADVAVGHLRTHTNVKSKRGTKRNSELNQLALLRVHRTKTEILKQCQTLRTQKKNRWAWRFNPKHKCA